MEDTFIDKHHTEDLHKAYPGDKEIRIITGGHNGARPKYIMGGIASFFGRCLYVD